MKKKIIRNLFANVNKYQTSLLYPVLISALIVCISSFVLIFNVYNVNKNLSFSYNISTNSLQANIQINDLFSILKVIPGVITILAVCILLITLWAFYVSNKLLGSVQRIIRELDDIIASKEKRFLETRKNDEPLEDLLKRINVLINRAGKNEIS